MQKAFSFDQATIVKILKGATLAAAGAFAIYTLNFLGTVEIDNPMLASFVAWFVPTALNAVKEYVKGQ